MLKDKYNNLRDMLSKDYNISEFADSMVADIIGEYFLVDTGKEDYMISVFQEAPNKLEVLVEEYINDEWYKVDQKFYTNVKSAYNFIIKSI